MADETQKLTLQIATQYNGAGVEQAKQDLQSLNYANDAMRKLMAQMPQTQAGFQSVQRQLQAGGMFPNLRPQDFGIAAQSAGRVAEQTERAARSTREMSTNFTEFARVGAGLFGIGLGLNVAANVAQKLGDVIGGIVEDQIQYERTLRETNILWGSQATSVEAIARAQASMADQAGTVQEHLAAINALAQTTLRVPGAFGVNQLQAVTSAGFRASLALGEDPQARAARQAAIAQYIAQGGPGQANVGLAGTPQELAGILGFRSAAALGGLTQAQVAQARAQQDIIAQNRAALLPNAQGTDLMSLQAQAQKQLNDARSRLQTTLQGQQQITANPIGQSIAAGGGIGYAVGNVDRLQQATNDQIAALGAAREALDSYTQQIGDANTSIAKATDELNKLGLEANTATTRVLDFAGSLEDATSIARADVAAQSQAGLAQRAQGPNPLIAQSLQERFVTATQQAEQAAYRQFVAQQAQQNLLTNSPIREFLQRQANMVGPGLEDQRARAQAALADIDRRRAGALATTQAGVAGGFADRAATEANAQLQRIQIAQDERRLSVINEITAAKRQELELAGEINAVTLAQRTVEARATLASGQLQSIQIQESNRRLQYAQEQADLQKESLTLQGQMSPLLLEQARLQDRITIANRDNLDIRRQLISAQQAALGPEAGLQELNYTQQRIQLMAQIRQASLIRGEGGGGMPSFAELTQQFVQGELNRPAVELAALDAQQQVARAQRASTAEQLGRQMQGTDLEEQARALQDQLMPLEAATRETQARADALERTLTLMDLQDTAAKTSAEAQINLAQQQLIAINQTLVPLQLQVDAQNAVTQAIQNQLALLDLADEPSKAFWQTAVDFAATLKLDSDAAARSAGDFAANLSLGSTPAETIASALERGQQALEKINTMSAALPGGGPLAPGAGGGVNLGGISVTINGAPEDTEAIVNEAVSQFETQLRQALAASGSAPPPVTTSLVGARRG